jgi:hypothetical protein
MGKFERPSERMAFLRFILLRIEEVLHDTTKNQVTKRNRLLTFVIVYAGIVGLNNFN